MGPYLGTAIKPKPVETVSSEAFCETKPQKIKNQKYPNTLQKNRSYGWDSRAFPARSVRFYRLFVHNASVN